MHVVICHELDQKKRVKGNWNKMITTHDNCQELTMLITTARKKAGLAYTRRRAPADNVTEHLQRTCIHHHTHTHTHTRVTSEIHAHAHAAIVYYDSLQLTSSMHKAKEKGHRAHGQNEIMHAYGPKSTPIAQGLVEDINAMHAYGRSSAPIAQGLVYDIIAPHAFGLRESKRTYRSVTTPIAQGLVEIINAKDTKMVMSPKAQGLVSNTHAEELYT